MALIRDFHQWFCKKKKRSQHHMGHMITCHICTHFDVYLQSKMDMLCRISFLISLMAFKGASFCYAYLLCILGLIPDTKVSLRNCPLIEGFFVWFMTVEKVGFSKGYQNAKRKLGVIMHFSEITELKFGGKLPYILCILKLFWNYGCLVISETCMVTHIFF